MLFPHYQALFLLLSVPQTIFAHPLDQVKEFSIHLRADPQASPSPRSVDSKPHHTHSKKPKSRKSTKKSSQKPTEKPATAQPKKSNSNTPTQKTPTAHPSKPTEAPKPKSTAGKPGKPTSHITKSKPATGKPATGKPSTRKSGQPTSHHGPAETGTKSHGGGNTKTESGYPMVTHTHSCPSGEMAGEPTPVLKHGTIVWDTQCIQTHFPPVWNLGNDKCDDLTYDNDKEIWKSVDGDYVINNLTATFNLNLAYCPECIGTPVSKCKQASKSNPDYNEDCAKGLKDASGDRWDTAAARFANNLGLKDLRCDIQVGECSAAPSCKDCNGPGTWAVLKSLESINNFLNNIYNAMGEARDACDTQMTKFSSDFAPIPSPPSNGIWMSIVTGVLGTVSGLVSLEAPEVGVGISFVSAMASVAMNVGTAGPPDAPADTAHILGAITDSAQKVYEQIAGELFKTGKMSHDGTTVTMLDAMTDGQFLSEPDNKDDLYSNLKTNYEKAFYQQLAVYTWQNLEQPSEGSGSTQHIPFIAVDTTGCSGDSNLPDYLEPDSNTAVEYDGTCYYLLDGHVAQKPGPPGYNGSPGAPINYCSGNAALPGGTKDLLTGKGNVYAGLTLEDFVIPSVKGWLKNGKQNGFDPAAAGGKPITDIQQEAAVVLPVCDYISDDDNPGEKCPVLGGDGSYGAVCVKSKS